MSSALVFCVDAYVGNHTLALASSRNVYSRAVGHGNVIIYLLSVYININSIMHCMCSVLYTYSVHVEQTSSIRSLLQSIVV